VFISLPPLPSPSAIRKLACHTARRSTVATATTASVRWSAVRPSSAPASPRFVGWRTIATENCRKSCVNSPVRFHQAQLLFLYHILLFFREFINCIVLTAPTFLRIIHASFLDCIRPHTSTPRSQLMALRDANAEADKLPVDDHLVWQARLGGSLFSLYLTICIIFCFKTFPLTQISSKFQSHV
jgi:hypothetical protein